MNCFFILLIVQQLKHYHQDHCIGANMIVENQYNSFPFQDHIGNFIENKIRLSTFFKIDQKIYEHISVHKNVSELKIIENICDHYLQESCLDDITINKLLDLRDHVIMRTQSLEREAKMLVYLRSLRQDDGLQGYSHSMQLILPEELRLTDEQKMVGYLPRPGEPIEYICGCLTMCYHVACECYKPVACEIYICDNMSCNQKINPDIKLTYMCEKHRTLSQRKVMLEHDLVKIKKELSSINYFNSLDFKDMHKNKKSKRVSRFPWKNKL